MARGYDFCEFRQLYCRVRQLFGVVAEFARQHIKDFVNDIAGNHQVHVAREHLEDSSFRPPGMAKAEMKILVSKTALTYGGSAPSPSR